MTEDPHKWRIERFEALGFSFEEAHALARSRDTQGVPVYWGNVKQVLDLGANHVQALDIFVEEPVSIAALIIEGSE